MTKTDITMDQIWLFILSMVLGLTIFWVAIFATNLGFEIQRLETHIEYLEEVDDLILDHINKLHGID